MKVFGIEPDLTREGGSIPVTLTFQEATGKTVLLLPIGASDDGAHSQVCLDAFSIVAHAQVIADAERENQSLQLYPRHQTACSLHGRAWAHASRVVSDPLRVEWDSTRRVVAEFWPRAEMASTKRSSSSQNAQAARSCVLAFVAHACMHMWFHMCMLRAHTHTPVFMTC
jgi:hypothetical protein